MIGNFRIMPNLAKIIDVDLRIGQGEPFQIAEVDFPRKA